MMKETPAHCICLYYAGQKWKDGVHQPKEISEVYSMIESHPDYANPAKVSSLTRWILQRVCKDKLSMSDEANDAWARSLWEMLHWGAEDYGFSEGEGREALFEKVFSSSPPE